MALPPAQFVLIQHEGRLWLQDYASKHSPGIRDGAAKEKLRLLPFMPVSDSPSCLRSVTLLNRDFFGVYRCRHNTVGEAQMHLKVYERLNALWPIMFPGLPRGVLVPEIKATIAWPLPEQRHEPFFAFMTERIHPLPEDVVRSMVTRPCTNKPVDQQISHLKWQLMDLIPRLGEMQPPEDRDNPSVSTRSVYFDMLRAENAEYPVVYSRLMGAALALLHWGLHVDGEGVVFHLGSEKDGSTLRLWMTNFASSKPFTPSAEAVGTRLAWVVAGSPMWPRPPLAANLQNRHAMDSSIHNAWMTFSVVYVRVSRRVMEENGCLEEFGTLPGHFVVSLRLLHLWDNYKKDRALQRKRIKAASVASSDARSVTSK